MMYEEFERIAGYRVSYETYANIIEPMYMALNVDKETFCTYLNKKAFALPTRRELVTKMRKLARHLAETCEHYTDYPAKQELEKVINTYAEQFHHIDRMNTKTGGWYTSSRYTFPHGRGCSFPCSVTFYNGDYHDAETIDLVTDIGYRP